jgi:hypothetical protein
MSAQLGPFEVGQIKAHMEHGLGCTTISRKIFKADGKTPFSEHAIWVAMCKLKENNGWRGEREEGSGAPRKTTAAEDKRIIKWVLDQRGKRKVSAPAVKKRFPTLRKFDDTLIYDRLDEAELVYMRRRRKPIVGKTYYRQRINYCEAVKRKHQSTLEKWAYTDGTTYFLDRNDGEHEHSVRRALGPYVWRKSDNSDAMWEDCIGPSAYSKGQGKPVKVWGMLACGVINIEILDEGEAMDTALYVELIEDKFEDWAFNCEYLVCDFEGCIRSEQAVWALQKVGLTLVEDYPVSSQDFNAMENAWFILKQRLDETMPIQLESRDDFIKRLKSAVQWANRNRAEQLWHLCTNQKERADDCLQTKPKGGRTKY